MNISFKIRLVCIVFSLLILFQCKKEELNVYSNASELSYKNFKIGDEVVLDYKAESGKVDSIRLILNDSITFPENRFTIDSLKFRYGSFPIKIEYYYDKGKVYNDQFTLNILTNVEPEKVQFQLVNTYYHNPQTFTEGLFYSNNLVYESSGLLEKSYICNYKLGSEKFTTLQPQEAKYFSEGCTQINNQILQLTWKEGAVFIYDENLQLISQTPLPSEITEGWGLTSDNRYLYVTNGTSNIYKLSFVNNELKVEGSVSVADNKQVYKELNELEMINGFLYANIWHKNIILKINPSNGVVMGVLDLTPIVQQENPTNPEAVLNGIAHVNEQLLVTGKYWNHLYLLQIK